MGVLVVQGGKCTWEGGREMEKRSLFINRNSMYENATRKLVTLCANYKDKNKLNINSLQEYP